MAEYQAKDLSNFYSIMNSRIGALVLNYNTSGCSLTMSKVFQSISPKDIQKGQKIYDWKNSMFFTITLDEAVLLNEILSMKLKTKQWIELTSGTVSCTNSGNYPGLSVTHFRQNTKSILTFANDNGKNDNNFLRLFYHIGGGNNNSGVNFNIGLSFVDTKIFMKYFDNLSTFISSYLALSKYENIKKYSNNNQQPQNQNNNDNYGGYGQQDNNNTQDNNYGYGIPQDNNTNQQNNFYGSTSTEEESMPPIPKSILPADQQFANNNTTGQQAAQAPIPNTNNTKVDNMVANLFSM